MKVLTLAAIFFATGCSTVGRTFHSENVEGITRVDGKTATVVQVEAIKAHLDALNPDDHTAIVYDRWISEFFTQQEGHLREVKIGLRIDANYKFLAHIGNKLLLLELIPNGKGRLIYKDIETGAETEVLRGREFGDIIAAYPNQTESDVVFAYKGGLGLLDVTSGKLRLQMQGHFGDLVGAGSDGSVKLMIALGSPSPDGATIFEYINGSLISSWKLPAGKWLAGIAYLNEDALVVASSSEGEKLFLQVLSSKGEAIDKSELPISWRYEPIKCSLSVNDGELILNVYPKILYRQDQRDHMLTSIKSYKFSQGKLSSLP